MTVCLIPVRVSRYVRGFAMPPHFNQSRWFADEVHPHDAHLKAYLRGAFPAVRDIDDVAQESYLWLWKARAREPIRSARALLFKVAKHIAIDLLRRERSAPFGPSADLTVLEVADDRRGVAETVSAEEKVRLVTEAMLALPHRCREAVVFYRLQGLPRREVARRLGVTEKTVDEQVARGTRRIESYLRARGVTDFSEQ